MNEYILLKKCKYRIKGSVQSKKCIIYISGTFMDVSLDDYYNKVSLMSGISDYCICELCVEDWDKYLTPWPVNEEVLKGRKFGGKATDILQIIEEIIIPDIHNNYEYCDNFYVAGYSLAGLFSMWSCYKSSMLVGAVCCSGSLWYPGWKEFIDNRKNERVVYLSLGDKEHKTKNPVMGRVLELTQYQNELLTNSFFELNPGGHFNNVDERIMKGMCWILSH